MTDFIAAQADLILPELVGGYAPEYVHFDRIGQCGCFLLLNDLENCKIPDYNVPVIE